MPPSTQAYVAVEPVADPSRPAMNAFQHGMRSASVLLPGDDVQEFQHMREDLLHTYRPCTREEMRCVDRMAACQWRMERYGQWEAVFDTKLQALLYDVSGKVAQHCDPDPHRWQHRAIDCTLQESRFERMLLRAERRLLDLQRLRRNGLLAPGDRLLDPRARGPEKPATANAGAAALCTDPPASVRNIPAPHGEPELSASASHGGGIGKNSDRESGPVAALKPPLSPCIFMVPQVQWALAERLADPSAHSLAAPPAQNSAPPDLRSNLPHAAY